MEEWIGSGRLMTDYLTIVSLLPGKMISRNNGWFMVLIEQILEGLGMFDGRNVTGEDLGDKLDSCSGGLKLKFNLGGTRAVA